MECSYAVSGKFVCIYFSPYIYQIWLLILVVLNIFGLLQGEIEFKGLLFIPPMAPWNAEEMWHSRRGDVRLYVKRVFISDQFNGELVSTHAYYE